jgi:nitric oxide reductase activation protein
LLFVVSDGQPYAYNYDGKSAIEDTRKKVIMSEALDFQVIQIAIEEGIPSKEMFNQYIKMTDIKNLPNDLINFASRKIDKLIKSKTVL